jgi:type I restriction enzyme R subunit
LVKEDGAVYGISTGTPTSTEDEKDLLSNIIKTLNDTYGVDISEEDKVDIEMMQEKLHEHNELREVMNSNNTLDNMKYKFDQVVDDLLLEFVNTKLGLYKKLSDPKVNPMFKTKWFEGYRRQFDQIQPAS